MLVPEAQGSLALGRTHRTRSSPVRTAYRVLWHPRWPTNCELDDNEPLCAVLRKTAVKREVMAALRMPCACRAHAAKPSHTLPLTIPLTVTLPLALGDDRRAQALRPPCAP